MIITALKETGSETRVAISPQAAKQYIKLGFEVAIEENAGLASDYSNEDYKQANVTVISQKKKLLEQTHILLCVNEPSLKDLEQLTAKTLIIGPFDNDPKSQLIQFCQKQQLSLFSMILYQK